MSDEFAAPSFLGPVGQKEWSRIVVLLQERGMLDPLRRASLESYALAYEHWIATEQQLARAKKPTAIDRLVGLSNGYQRRLRAAMHDLGLPIQVHRRNTAVGAEKGASEDGEDVPARPIGDYFKIKAPH